MRESCPFTTSVIELNFHVTSANVFASFEIYCVWAWMTGACEVTLLQSINVGTKVMVAVTLSSLPGSSTSYLMAVGGLDSQVHLYVGGVTGQVLSLLQSSHPHLSALCILKS